LVIVRTGYLTLLPVITTNGKGRIGQSFKSYKLNPFSISLFA